MSSTPLSRIRVLAALAGVLLCLFAVHTSEAFRFTLSPGRSKCFTDDIHEEGRYELRYRMVRSLTPFVSVSVTAPGGRILLEHEVARPDAKEIVTLKQPGTIAICFNTAEKASKVATSLNVTLDIIDAEDAELTRMKKQSYSTSSPIALGAGKGSGAMQQAMYILKVISDIRGCITYMTRTDEDMRLSLAEVQRYSWVFMFVFVGFATLVTLISYARMRRFMQKQKVL